METLSYNEKKSQRLQLRHIMWPDIYGFFSEAIIGILLLVLFNVSELSNRLLKDTSNNNDPLSYSFSLLTETFSTFQQNHIFEQVSIFLLWAVAGALIYILLFRILQLISEVSYSMSTGLKIVRKEHASGILHWLSTMHDFFLKVIFIFVGVLTLFIGAFVVFGIASQQLRSGLVYNFPSNIGPFIFSLVSIVLSMRLIVLGISLLSSHFRNWYTQ